MASRAVMLLRRAPALAGFGAAAARRAPRVAAVRAFASEPLSPTVGPTKQRTGLVGIEVVPNAREVLVSLYEKTLKDIQIIPEGVAYRNAVEAFTKYRLEVVRRLDNIQAIEDEIGCGQVEELIEIAKDELELIPEYASWKEWEEPYLKPSVDDMSDLAHDLGAMEKGSA